MPIPTSEQLGACTQIVQEHYIKLDILDIYNNIVDSIAGLIIDGNLTIDNLSAIRRTVSLKFVLTTKTLISQTSPLWINKRFRLWIGRFNILTGNIIYFNMGIFLINDPSIDIKINERTIDITGLDKMALLDGTLSGQLTTKTVINVGTVVSDAIASTISQLGGESSYLVDTSPYTVPYKIDHNVGDNVYDVLKTLQELYMTYKCFYDINGTFRFTQINSGINDSIVFDFSQFNVCNEITQNILYSNVRNHFYVVGRVNANGTQYHSEKYITDADYPDSPFTIEKMGTTRTIVVADDKYFTQEQVDSMRDYQIYKHFTLADTIVLKCLPLLFLDVDELIYIDMPEFNMTGIYLIDNVQLDLKYDALMQITAHNIINN